ncbi:dihydroxyacetone kinase [Erwinia sp. OLTSP20]|nr:dihydroxyacetone kinase [Erwinia sp. OAMSP11]PIJ71920.1 dihydroxyacetone kinase [Erwinia sp. OLSSP12]PIJ81122.1 dihydroxyacetone kinase [Erwinia sp. OLCASP19]PIJ83552.1 dihydroxyacetone kinase [Erwinia sp. OLMTSP26]PIJ86167.1 dihydroxyacetone kinase [Erwinia sp. OLMDSP33]PIJ89686.1 dihydroxyacetone kinase [Erwinia sp. OLFS4]PIJ92290.1 dihydroxyacetone kinase [Erwinia sp. OLTSP20]
MKKILNSPEEYADQALQGMCQAFPHLYAQSGESGRVITRAIPAKDKPGIVSGGGSGHLPTFAGYVGPGLLDACAVGNVFAGPAVMDCMAAIRAADNGKGVLLLFGNYGGDKMNFAMAAEMLEAEGIRTRTVLACDDVGSASRDERLKRRGVAGLIYAYKVAGARAEQPGATLDDVAEIARRALDNTVTLGVALSPCTVPEAGKPTFTLADNEMEIGMGIHGEPGIRRGPLLTADTLADEMLTTLCEDSALEAGDRVAVMVNSLGATPLEELFILWRRIQSALRTRNISWLPPQIGRYATSMEMAGASLTLMKLDDELASLLATPVVSP